MSEGRPRSGGPAPTRRVTLMWVPEAAQGEVLRWTLELARVRRLGVAVVGGALALLFTLGAAVGGVGQTAADRALVEENLALKGRLLALEGRLDTVDGELLRLRLYDQQIGGPEMAPPAEGPLDADEAAAGALHEEPGRLPALGEAGDPMDELDPGDSLDLRLRRASGRLDAVVDRLQRLDARMGGLAEHAEAWRGVAPGVPTAWPLSGVLTSGFGWRRSPFTRQWKFHMGVDIAAPRGTVIVSPGPGTVVRSEYATGYGRVVEIDHGEGVVTRYGHNARLLVADGQAVRAGQPIATVGMTGHTTGPHLHYEVYVNGQAVDPLEVLE